MILKLLLDWSLGNKMWGSKMSENYLAQIQKCQLAHMICHIKNFPTFLDVIFFSDQNFIVKKKITVKHPFDQLTI